MLAKPIVYSVISMSNLLSVGDGSKALGVDRVDSIYQYLCTLNMTIPKATTYQTVAGKVDIKIVTLPKIQRSNHS